MKSRTFTPASGSAPLRYQWYFNATAMTDATNTSLSIVNAQFTNAAGGFLFAAT